MSPGEGTALSNWSPLGRQPHNPNLARTPVDPLQERGGIGFYINSASSVYYVTAGHHNYGRYLSRHCLEMSVLLPAEAKDDLLSGTFVCRHKAGSWNAVSTDKFGELTTIKIGKDGLNGITLSSTQVAEWIDSFPISAYVSDTLDHCYSPNLSSSSSETPHKEEGAKRCKVDEDDRQRIST